MKNYFILISIGVFILGSCKKPKTDKPYIPVIRCTNLSSNADSINLYIHGNWEWVEDRSFSRYNGIEYFTPTSVGYYPTSLKLQNDTALFFVNNKIDSVYRFQIQRELEITNFPTDSLPVLVFYSFYTQQLRWYVPIKTCRNQLLMQYISSRDVETLWVRK